MCVDSFAMPYQNLRLFLLHHFLSASPSLPSSLALTSLLPHHLLMCLLVCLPFLAQLLEHALRQRLALLVVGRKTVRVILGKFLPLRLLKVRGRRNPGLRLLLCRLFRSFCLELLLPLLLNFLLGLLLGQDRWIDQLPNRTL